ncbi:MAG: bacteriorhodopsin [Candidatus Thalassarchaeaceae archaeon]
MESRYSKLSTRTIAIAAIVTCMALIVSPSTIAETVDPSTADWLNDGENDEIELLTFFLFFVGYIGMGAAFVFFVMERNNVAPEFRTTMTISALIVGVAAFHYFYMRNVYIEHQTVSIEYRYMDWLVTVPLMALKFPSLVGKDAITDAKIPVIGGFANVCFFGAVWMIGWGYAGESGMVDGMLALILSGMGWAMIIVATGTPWTAGKGVDDTKVREELKWSLNALRTFIVVGWIIYPVGYLYSPEVAIMTPNEEMMAVAYNIADSINKIGFGVVAWMGAKKATAAMA